LNQDDKIKVDPRVREDDNQYNLAMANTTYFDAAAFRFLRALGKNNNREWFNAHKAQYEKTVRDPFLRLIGDLVEPLAMISPHFRADPRPSGGSMFRIYRDTRFANGGLWHPEPPTLKRIREFLVDNPATWKKAVRSKRFRERFELGGESLTRPPSGFDAQHELIDDIKRKDFVASAEFTDVDAMSPRLKPLLVDTFKSIAPMVDYLCAALDLEF
jgi:uncharacterized protein (DUF2461 family)